MKTRMMYATSALLAMSALGANAQVATPTATTTADAKWNAWYGCWRPEAIEGVAPPEHVVCVVPESSNGVSIATVANGKIVSETKIIADGVRRPAEGGGCKGFESAQWSQDSRRLFLKSDLNCGGDVQRQSSGVLALISAASYVDVQTVDVGGQKASRTVRYVALRDDETPAVIASRLLDEPLARESARMRASAPLDFEDVVEATRIAGNETVDGLLVARKAGFDLNASRLRTLAREGVKPSTIDVMVALTYPEHFQVAEQSSRASTRLAGEGTQWGYDGLNLRNRANSCFDTYGLQSNAWYGYDPYAQRYGRCGYNSYYSPYGYDAVGWGYGTGPVVVVAPGSVTAGATDDGVVVKGKGYTRRGASTTTGTARPREAPATTRSTGTSTAGSTGTVRSTGSSGSGASAGSGSSSSGTATGRTAKPKGGGGGL